MSPQLLERQAEPLGEVQPSGLVGRYAMSRARRRRIAIQKWGPAYVLIAPATILIVLMMVYPTLQTVFFSLSRVKLPSFQTTFVGLQNFIGVFVDGATGPLAQRTLVWVVATVVLRFVLGFGAALVFNASVKGTIWMRILALLPWTVPSVVAANLWRWILHTDAGVLNETLRMWGIPEFALNWLGNPDTALLAVTVAYSWAGYPFVMLLILAGLQGIPREYYEAAQVDGANWWQLFRFITLPAMSTILGIAILLETISALNSFDTLFVMAGGGPARATEIWSLAVYRTAFVQFDLGGASALSLVLFIGVLACIALYGSANAAAKKARDFRK